MMKLATCEQMRSLDKIAIEKYGMPGIALMENAARSIFEKCRDLAAYKAKRVGIACGTGNNGGDGFALARLFANDDTDVSVIISGKAEKLSGDALVNYRVCAKMGLPIVEGGDEADFRRALEGRPLVIDAMLGTGVSGALKSPVREAVSAVNNCGAFVVAVDCPTGGDPDNGHVSDICVKSDLTVTLALMKPGLLLYPLAGFVGRVEIGNIGAPRPVFDDFSADLYSLGAAGATSLLPVRPARSNKGTFGKIAIIAGSKSMTGAAAFAARAAYKAGAGLVNACAPASVIPIIQLLAPQAVTTPLPEENGMVCEASAAIALETINKSTVCLIGPGLGLSEGVKAFVRHVILNAKTPLIIDADAINALAGTAGLLKQAAKPPVITPHPLEMSRLAGLPVEQILADTLDTARDFSAANSCVTVLKDASTIIAGPDGTAYINNGACSALAKAGSGDILAGLIAGFMAQGLKSADASALAAYIHSESGKAAAAKLGEYSVGADDLLDGVAKVIAGLM